MRSITFMALLLVTASVMAQGWKGNGGQGWGRKSDYVRNYDPRTVETLSGTIVDVQSFTPGKGMSNGLHVTLKTDKSTVDVHLGPAWFLDNQDIELNAGDAVSVEGSRVTFGNASAIIAARIVKGDDTLVLRDRDGTPVWNAWRRKGR